MKKISDNLLGIFIVELLIVYVINKMIFNNQWFIFLIFLLTFQFSSIIFTFYYSKHHKMQIKKVKQIKESNAFLFVTCLVLVFVSIFHLEYRTVKIKSLNDFNKIYLNPDGKYSITKDIDMKLYDLKDDFNFYGTLEGNNHTLLGLKNPLFSHLKNAQINELNLKDVNIQMSDITYIGALSRTSRGSKIYKVNVTGNLSGSGYVGGIIGDGPTITVDLSSFVGTIINKGTFTGGITGSGGKINRSYVKAVIQGVDYVGGFSGDSSNVKNSISNSHIRGESNVSGSVSCISYHKCYTENTIIQGTIETIGKKEYNHFMYLIDTYENQNNLFLGRVVMAENAILTNKSKVYVLDNSIVLNTNQQYISYIDNNDLTYIPFYLSINFDETIWDFSAISAGNLPQIKGANFDIN